MNEKVAVAISPHIRSKDNITQMMGDVIIALLPSMFIGVYFYRWLAVKLIITCVVSCCLSEYLSQKIMKKETTLFDLSAVVTGILLAFCLPPSLPIWIAGLGGFSAIILGKQIFGGLGHNPFNPALVGRAVLQVSWPKALSTWITPLDGLTTATPLTITKLNLEGIISDYTSLFVGNCAGCLGETPKLALLIGGLYLLVRGRIKLSIPLSYIISVAVLALIFQKDVLFHILTGGLILGAFFMATDPGTSPLTSPGKIIFGIGCGFLTMLIRLKGGFPEGVCYSILIMNMFTPIIDKHTRIKRFGV